MGIIKILIGMYSGPSKKKPPILDVSPELSPGPFGPDLPGDIDPVLENHSGPRVKNLEQ